MDKEATYKVKLGDSLPKPAQILKLKAELAEAKRDTERLNRLIKKFGCGDEDDGWYLSQEYIGEGRNLREAIDGMKE